MVGGLETAFGLELLSSVQWVATREKISTAEDAVERLYDWNDRKRRFAPEQIHLAWNVLAEKGWLAS